MSSPAPVSTLPPVRRVVTQVTADGRHVVQLDEATPLGPRQGVFAHWGTNSFPANLQAEGDGATLSNGKIVTPNGTGFLTVDFPPLNKSPMHFTHSIDYAVVIAGTVSHLHPTSDIHIPDLSAPGMNLLSPYLKIHLTLPDSPTVILRAGDTVVQRGTLHAWENPSDTEWGRMAFVVSDGKEILLEGGKKVEGLKME